MVTPLPPIAEPIVSAPERTSFNSEEKSSEDRLTFSQTMAKRLENKEPVKKNDKSELTEKPVKTSDKATEKKDATEKSDADETDVTERTETKEEIASVLGATSEITAQVSVPPTRPELLLAQMMQAQATSVTESANPENTVGEKTSAKATVPTSAIRQGTELPIGKAISVIPVPATTAPEITENSMDSHTAKAETRPVSGVDFPPQAKAELNVTAGEMKSEKPEVGKADHQPGLSRTSPELSGRATANDANIESMGQKPTTAPVAEAENLSESSPDAGRLNEQMLRANARVDVPTKVKTNESITAKIGKVPSVPQNPVSEVVPTQNALQNSVAAGEVAVLLEEKAAVVGGRKAEISLSETHPLTSATKPGDHSSAKANSREGETPQESGNKDGQEQNALFSPQTLAKPTEGIENNVRPPELIVSPSRPADTVTLAKDAAYTSPDPDRANVIAQMQKHTERMVAIRGSGEVDIRLTPEHLGALHIRIVKDGESVIARISAENERVKQVLESGQQDLREALKERGLNVKTLEFTTETSAFGNKAGEQFSNAFTQSDPNAQRHFSRQTSLGRDYTGEKEVTPISVSAPKPERNRNGRLDFRA